MRYKAKWLHRNYVDCVCFLGDCILSKSCANKIHLWKPHLEETSNDQTPLCQCVLAIVSWGRSPRKMHRFDYDGGELWFLRFGLDPQGQFLAVGTQNGVIYVWDLYASIRNRLKLSAPKCNLFSRISLSVFLDAQASKLSLKNSTTQGTWNITYIHICDEILFVA